MSQNLSSSSQDVSGAPPPTSWNSMYTGSTQPSSLPPHDISGVFTGYNPRPAHLPVTPWEVQASSILGNNLLAPWDAYWLQDKISRRFFYNSLECPDQVTDWAFRSGYCRDWTPGQWKWFVYFIGSIHALSVKGGPEVTCNEAMHILRNNLQIVNITIVRVAPHCYLLYPVAYSAPRWSRDAFSAVEQAYVHLWAPGGFWPVERASAAIEDGEWDELSREIGNSRL